MTVKETDHISRVMIKCSISGEVYIEATGAVRVDSVRGKYSQLRGGRLHVADIVHLLRYQGSFHPSLRPTTRPEQTT